ncbi:MAG: OsmC family peroxiredoxin [Actinomycetota bacterium]|nr:OsmC family peroxiredoxin [Actinomycetota bacterium]
MALKSTGRAHWEGDLMSGNGIATLDSGAAGPMQVTWKARTEEHGGLTSPEELIATAHATCYSMSLSNILAKAGTPPTALDTEATATFVPGEGITSMELTVRGTVEGMNEEDFLATAEAAKEACPVSKALQGNVSITLSASLA